MAVLVLGGAGYIGSHFVHALLERGAEVVVVDNLQTGHAEAVHPKARFAQGDIRDEAFLDGVFQREKIDSVVHFAANSLVGESVADPMKYYDNNFYGTMVLVRAMLRHGVEKIVFSSTAATYGEPENVPILETDRTKPENPYGETKLAMETMFKWVAQAASFRYVPLRYFNASGALAGGSIGEDHRPESHLIPIVLQVANGQRDTVAIFGDDYETPDGTCLRDYIHVSDLAGAHIQALEYLNRGGQSDVFNLGNGVGFSVREVVAMCRKVTGSAIPEVVSPRRAGDPARLVASSEKARRVLGFNPAHSDLEEIVSSAWQWHKTHPRGYAG
jgi:UDP-glucose 4-epimerase